MAKKKNKIESILRRPLVRLVLFILVIILVIVGISKLFKGNKNNNEDNKLIGYQRLVNVSDNGEYTYLDLEGKTKKYDGYKSMSDFYYDVTNVSRENPKDAAQTEYGLINKNGGQVVKFGNYENIIQVIGGKYYKVLKDNKFGVVNYTGKTILEPKYDYISVITVQDGNEFVFECQNADNYDFINENGKVLMSTASAQHTISYINRLNSNYDTIVKITLESENKYFNLRTGEELFAGENIANLSYNILKQSDKIVIYSKDYKKNVTLDTSADYSADARAYFNKYVLVEQKNVSTGTKSYKYTVYDENLKVVAESENRINIVKAASGEIYFLTNETDGVKITNENKKSKKIKGYEFNSNSISDLQALVLNPVGDTSTNSLFNFKGKMLEEKIQEYYYKGSSLKVTSSEGKSFLLFTNNSRYELVDQDSINSTNNYLTVENLQDGTTSVITHEGKVIINRAAGTKIFYNDDYIGLQQDKTIDIYNVNTGKKTFSYQMGDYIDRDETVNYVELVNGYYLFSGKELLKK